MPDNIWDIEDETWDNGGDTPDEVVEAPEDARPASQRRAQDLPAPKAVPVNVPPFDAAKIRAQAMLGKTLPKVEAAQEELQAAIDSGDQQAQYKAIDKLANAAIAHDRAERDAFFHGVDDERLAADTRRATLDYEKAAVELRQLAAEYGENSLTYREAMEAYAEMGGLRRLYQQEAIRREEQASLDLMYTETATAKAEAAYKREVEAEVEAKKRENAPAWEIMRLQTELSIPFDGVKDKDARIARELEALREDKAQRDLDSYRDGIMARFAIDNEVRALFGRTAEEADAILSERAELAKKVAEAESTIDEWADLHPNLAAAVAAAKEGQNYISGMRRS